MAKDYPVTETGTFYRIDGDRIEFTDGTSYPLEFNERNEGSERNVTSYAELFEVASRWLAEARHPLL